MSESSQPPFSNNGASLSLCKRPAAEPLDEQQQDGSVAHDEGHKRARTSEGDATITNLAIVNAIGQVNQHVKLPPTASSAVIHLSVTKVEPSYTEPWRKMSPVFLEGVGILFDWGNHESNIAAGAQVVDPAAKTGTNKNLRILTTASTVHHAASIRASIPYSSSPNSVSCIVEWVSLPMDLAVIKLSADDISWGEECLATISDRFLELGEHVKIVGVHSKDLFHLAPTSLGGVKRSDNKSYSKKQQQLKNSGTVSNYFADEDQHFMLRMALSMPSLSSAGGIVLDQNGDIVGLMKSDLTVIPGVMLCQIIDTCKHIMRGHEPNERHGCSTILVTDATPLSGESDRGEPGTSQSDEGKSHCDSDHSKSKRLHVKSDLLGLASLGITGYQTMENKALRKSFNVDIDGDDGVRITGVHHTAHSSANTSVAYHQPQCNMVGAPCHSSSLRVDDILLAVNDEPVMLDGTIKLAPGRERERINFQWLISKCNPGSQVNLDVIRQKKKLRLTATLCEPKYLVPKLFEQTTSVLPSYAIAGGCVFVPLSHAWIQESRNRYQNVRVDGYHRYLQERANRGQQLIVLSHVLSDDVNLGYHEMSNMLLISVNGQRLTNMQHLVDILVKSKTESILELKCSDMHSGRGKIVISLDSKMAMNSEFTILTNHMIDSWCSPNALSPALKKDSERKAHRHGVNCGLKTLRALRNAASETTLVVQKPKTANERAISTTKRILSLSEAHKMQSAPNFSGKYVEDVGWTQVKTKHLSQLCVCGKSTRFYCICSVGVMRCKDCFLKHCRDHMSNGEDEGCDICGEKTELLAEGIDLVTSKKRKPNNPNQAVQSRCAVCKAKTCLCCSACGSEPEVPLCDVTTGRNCLAIHISEHHSCKHNNSEG